MINTLKTISVLAMITMVFALEGRIHVIGDSHTAELSSIDNCVIHYMGPRTMYRVGRDGQELVDFRSFDIQEDDTVVLVFGEIDVRCHIGKQRDFHHRRLDEIINSLVTNYLSTILLNKQFYKNIQIVIYTVTPPIPVAFNLEYESYGAVEDRVFISRALNQKLYEFSVDLGIEILDVYNEYSDENGILIPKLSDGSVHIDQRFNHEIQRKLKAIIKKNS